MQNQDKLNLLKDLIRNWNKKLPLKLQEKLTQFFNPKFQHFIHLFIYFNN